MKLVFIISKNMGILNWFEKPKQSEKQYQSSFEEIVQQTKIEDALDLFESQNDEALKSLADTRLQALIYVFEENFASLDSKICNKVAGGYLRACDRIARRQKLNLDDVTRKLKIFGQITDLDSSYLLVIENYAKEAFSGLIGKKLLELEGVDFYEELSDPNSTDKIVPKIDQIASWFIESYSATKNSQVRERLFDVLGWIDLRSTAFGLATELKKKMQEGEKQELLKSTLKSTISEILARAKPEPETFPEVNIKEVPGFAMGSHKERKDTGAMIYSYNRVIRPEDREFLEKFLK